MIPKALSSSNVKTNRRWALIMAYVCLTLFIIFFLFPPFYMIITSLKTNEEISSMKGFPFIIQQGVTLSHYVKLLTETPFLTFFKNTAIVTFFSVTVSMVISVLAAYALSRLRFWGSSVLALGVFLTYLVPETLLFIPLFKVIGGLGLLNSKWALVVVFPTLSVPFCTWIMIGYFASIPKDLDEAAVIDGASWYKMLFYIFIPVAMPGIIAATIFAFTISWANFIYPLAFLYSNDELVLTVGIVSTLIRGDVMHWGGLMAGALLAAAPPVIIYAFLMDYYISGLTAGAVKN
jgi:multiple sugar transport system permease protein